MRIKKVLAVVVVAISVIGITEGTAEARRGRGADDGAGHVRRARGADDGPGHVRHGRDHGPNHS